MNETINGCLSYAGRHPEIFIEVSGIFSLKRPYILEYSEAKKIFEKISKNA